MREKMIESRFVQKAPGEKMRALQIRRKQQLERVGFSVYCLDSLEQIRPILDEVGGETP